MANQNDIIWPGSVAKAKEIQQQLAKQVVISSFQGDINYIAGIDVAFPNSGKTTRAAVVLLEYPSLRLVEQVVHESPTVIPYIPGVLSFREGGAVLKALKKLVKRPDLLMFDGQGVAHPLGLGIASHVGVVLNMPTIGIAKSCLIGDYNEPEQFKGATTDLVVRGQHCGYVVRSRTNVKPLFISPGHLITKEQALSLALECVTKFRLPEPTRLADKLSKSQ
ncbi:deoxyribonuclease V [Pseudoalteromonas sp. G4]|uniref:deoxyribonuclease V n=1 Tax=Pseudoalteromonas sp. G4 TaxID=2992761 RepID=UPI00237DBD51|nr:deoxyribonuclease V [Pseudoalteromonas sp. G4]MDE3273813.1 deoxyribonuclease V [Pseudoalteromonas sp. G4]